MSGSKYYDAAAALQVIGCVLEQPSLLAQNGEYFFNEEDFTNEFHRVMFGVLYNAYSMGTQHFNVQMIEDYLQGKEKSLGIYRANNGAEWIEKVKNNADITNFNYYYNRLKKMTLFRKYNEIGINLDWLYDPDEIIDIEKKERQNQYIDSLELDEIADMIDDKVLNVRETYVDNSSHVAKLLGDSVEETLEMLKEIPAIGAHLYDDYTNGICMGARRGKFYVRSAATGVGKSRSMMADACSLACERFWKNNGWEDTGNHEPVLFISVELDEEELQTMAVAFIAGVSEDKVIGLIDPSFEEAGRIVDAINILKNSNLYFEFLPDYGLIDIENSIKRNIRKNKTKYIFFDYITTSMKIISDLARQSGGMKLREDQVLFQLSSKLKDLASIYDVFIMSATQLNASFKTEKVPDQTLLAGAKAIANRIDVGMIMLTATEEDKEEILPICETHGYPVPDIKMSIYKNRRGKHNNILLWMVANKGQCRYDTVFVTDFAGNLINKEEFTFFDSVMVN